MKTWSDFHIELPGGKSGEVDTLCPKCSPARRKAHVRCLSANTDTGLWNCGHCGYCGSLEHGDRIDRFDQPKPYTKPNYVRPTVCVDPLVAWFAERHIPEAVVRRNGIDWAPAYMSGAGDEKVSTIQFPFTQRGEVVNVKLRTPHGKLFRQVAGAKKIVYGWDDLTEANCYVAERRTGKGDGFRVYIVEGECDKLACEVAGIYNVVSVPDGAPAVNAKNYASKFDYLNEGWPVPVESCEFVLAVDNDEPGLKLEDELKRRLDPEKCLRVVWPEGCKDANDVLRKYGPEELRAALEGATPYPIEGVFEVGQLAEQILNCYRYGTRPGLSTGWKNLDVLYTVEPGQLTIVTGIPSHGKSELLDHLMVNVMRLHGWRFAMCSPENYPPERHLGKLLAKAKGLPFVEGFDTRMTEQEVSDGIAWLHEHLHLILPEESVSIPTMIDTLRRIVHRHGIRGAILDPWNEFDHTRPPHLGESEHIGKCLGDLRRFGRKYGVAVWVVAHPKMLKDHTHLDDEAPVPTAYSISGSANWFNKADVILCPWRDTREAYSPTRCYVQKVRVRTLGRPGMVELDWQKDTGRYEEVYNPVGGVF
jgi:twinkle protein